MVSLVSPDAGTTESRYGLNGLLTEQQTGALRTAGTWRKYVYDVNRIKTIDYPSMPDVVYTYGASTETGDTLGNLAGRVKSVTMEGGSEQRFYDAFGNVNKTVTTLKHIGTTTLASPVVTMKFAYDWLGRMQTMTFPKIVDANWGVPTGDGEVVKYVYDKGGLIDRITGQKDSSSPVENYLTEVAYDQYGGRRMLVSGNGIVNAYTYSPDRHWLTTVNATAATSGGTRQFHALTYSYDRVGNITGMVNAPPNAQIMPDAQAVGVGPLNVTYGYDNLNQLTSATAQYRGHATFGYRYSATFGYDEIGNLKTKSQADTKTSFTASATGFAGQTDVGTMAGTTYTMGYTYAGGRPHAASTVAETSSTNVVTNHVVTYDASGNNRGETAVAATRVLTWDEEDRLKQVDVSGTTKGRFLYSASGERTQKQEANGLTTFYVNQYLVLHGNKNVTKHIYAGDTRIASKTESATMTTPVKHFYHPDHVGSTAYITDGSQNLMQHERYFPFGESWVDKAKAEAATSLPRNWLFNAKELDGDTGYYYYGARYFEPRSAAWVSPDPILDNYMAGKPNNGVYFPLNLGLYSYTRNNPIAYSDPDGRVFWFLVGGAILYNLLKNQSTANAPTSETAPTYRSPNNLKFATGVIEGALAVTAIRGMAGPHEGPGTVPEAPVKPASPEGGASASANPPTAPNTPALEGVPSGGAAPLPNAGPQTPISSGTGRPTAPNTPNSIYEQFDPKTGDVRSRTFHDENGRGFSRQDFDHPHGGIQPHEHNRQFDGAGRPVTKEKVGQVPTGYNNKRSK